MIIVLELSPAEGSDSAQAVRIARDGAVVGRSQSVDVPIADASASRQHARLNRRGDQFEIENLSPNGTRVNGKPVDKRTLKDGDVIELGAATRFKVRYLTQTGALVSHSGAPGEAADGAAFDVDSEAAPSASAGVTAKRPSLLRRPKVIIGLSAYSVCLLAVCMVLSTHESSVQPPVGLSRDQIARMMDEYFAPESRAFEFESDGSTRRTPDSKKEREALARAREAFNTAPVSGRSLWAAATRFRDAQSYDADHTLRDPEDARRFRQAKEQFTEVLQKKYVRGVAAYQREQYKEAASALRELQDMLPDRRHPLAENVSRWLQAISRRGG